MYNAERGTLHISNPSDRITKTDYWDGKVGLMYPSDYGYASTNTKCRGNLYDCNTASNNWLFNSKYQWTLSPYSGSEHGVFAVHSNGVVYYGTAVNTIEIRPALFLKSDVEILSGDGTNDKPFVLE